MLGLTAKHLDVSLAAVDDDHLLHVLAIDGAARTSLWRTFGMTSADPRAAVLAQRAAESWPTACVERANATAPVGLVGSKTASWRRTLYALVAVADAALATAERARIVAAGRGR